MHSKKWIALLTHKALILSAQPIKPVISCHAKSLEMFQNKTTTSRDELRRALWETKPQRSIAS